MFVFREENKSNLEDFLIIRYNILLVTYKYIITTLVKSSRSDLFKFSPLAAALSLWISYKNVMLDQD